MSGTSVEYAQPLAASAVTVVTGVYGDGQHNDRPAIQRALDKAGPNSTVAFPTGTFLLSDATLPQNRILQVYPGQVLVGNGSSTLLVGNAFGHYVTVLGFASDSTYGSYTMRGMTIDQNSANNPLDIPNMGTYPAMAVRLGEYSNAYNRITIEQNTFQNADCVNTLYLYGRIIKVRGNDFIAQGGPAGTAKHDHSTVYTTVTTTDGVVNVCNNTFEGVLGSGGSTTAIETHGGIQCVDANNVTGYQAFTNITGIGASGLSTDGISVSNNVVSRCLIGVHIWSEYTAQLTTGSNLRNVEVIGNSIGIDRDPWNVVTGLLTYANAVLIDPGNTAPIEGLTIAGNTIDYRPSTTVQSNDLNSSAINLSVTNTTTAQIYDLKIVNNTIRNPYSTGINFNAVIQRMEVGGNTVLNPGTSADGTLASLYKSFGIMQKSVTDADFHHNRLYDDRGTHVAVYGVNCAGTLTAAVNVSFSKNFTRFSDGTNPQAFVTPLAGFPVFVDEFMDVAALPGINTKVGSVIREITTGKVYTQITAPSGTTWKLGAELGMTTSTVAPAAGAAAALPATPAGYETRNINGTDRQVAYY